MGRPSSCCCICGGACNKPLAIGVMPGQMALYDSPPQASLAAGYTAFKADWAFDPLTFAYNLQTSAELLETDFLSLRNGKIDIVILGDTPAASFGDIATADIPSRIAAVYFPAPDSDDEDAIFAYLAAGGTVLVKNTFPRSFDTGVERSYSADKQAEMAEFLSRVGSSSTHVMAEDSDLPYPHETYLPLIPPSGCISVNPDNVLGRGIKRNRARSVWRFKLLADAHIQLGYDWYSGSFSNIAPTDITADNSRPHIAVTGYPAPRGKLSSKLINPNQQDWFIVSPEAGVMFPSAHFSSTTHAQVSNPPGSSYYAFRLKTTGEFEENGSRFVDIVATAEQLPGGGKLIVVSPRPLVVGPPYDKPAYELALEAVMRSLSGCDNLSRNSITLVGT